MSLTARAKAWLVEPPATFLDYRDSVPTGQERAEPRRPVIAVVGLAPACGATTLARALAATLARRDPFGAAVVTGSLAVAGFTAPGRSAARLAARLSDDGSADAARAAGRLCLAETDEPVALARASAALAPVVLDLPRDRLPADAAAVARFTILVVPADAEPALAELAARSLDPRPLIVVTRAAAEDSGWQERGALLLPWSRIGAGLATAGFEPRGALGAAVARIADASEAAACG